MLLGKKLIIKSKLNRGISIVEILVVIAILGISVFAIIGVFPFGLSISRYAEFETIAANLAQSKLEELISKPYEELSIGTTTEPSLSALDVDFANFWRTGVINYLNSDLVDTDQDLGLKKLEVTVYWMDPKRATSSVTLVSVISHR